MSTRQQDLQHVMSQLQDLEGEARKVQTAFQKYQADVQEVIKARLEEFGIWEEISSLEAERMEAGRRAQEKIQKLNAKAADLQKVSAFLRDRELQEAQEKVPTLAPSIPKEVGQEGDGGGSPATSNRPSPPEFD